jgi:hypothetical protein
MKIGCAQTRLMIEIQLKSICCSLTLSLTMVSWFSLNLCNIVLNDLQRVFTFPKLLSDEMAQQHTTSTPKMETTEGNGRGKEI